MKIPAALIAILATSASLPGVTLYEMIVTSDVVFTHDSNGVNDPTPIPDAGSATIGSVGSFSWGNLATDTTPNTATFSGTSFTAGDWGGQGTFTSTTIDVSLSTSATITATGSSTFNSPPTEFFNFFYSLDGGASITFASGPEIVDVSAADELLVGFDFNHNGSSDNVNVSALSVDADVIPEPSSVILGGVGLLALLRRRR